MFKKLLFVILFLLVVSLNLSCIAKTDTVVYLETDKNVIEKENEIEITFSIRGEDVVAYYANLYFDNSKFEFISSSNSAKVDGSKVNVVWYDTEGGKGAKEGILGKVVFKAKEEGIAEFIIDGEFYNEKGNIIQSDFVSTQVQIGIEDTALKNKSIQQQGNNTNSSNANLEFLRVSEVGLVPNFANNILEYDLKVENDVENIEIQAIPENLNAQVEISGNMRIKRRRKSSQGQSNFRR